MPAASPFINLWNAGFRSLVPIIPPDAVISPASSLAKRPKAVGKTPGIKGRDGHWRGFDWVRHTTTESDLLEWHASGAGVGIRTGDGLVAVDVDTKAPDLCVEIVRAIQDRLGSAPIRIGDKPKFLVVFRTDDDIPYERIDFDDNGASAPKTPRVEILTAGRQFVAHGIHPDTRQPYHWPKPITTLDAIPKVTRQQVHDFFDYLATILPKAHQPVIEARSKEAPPQHTLTGDIQHVRRAINLLPNTEALFPTYDDYVRVGAAIKAAVPEDDATELFLQWAGRWEGGDFDAARALADFRRIKPPFKVGAHWLYEQAERATNGEFSLASVYFQPVNPDDVERQLDVFAQADELNRRKEQQDATIIWLDPKEWEGRDPPPRKWIVENIIPAAEVTLLTGSGGVGKTLLAQQLSTCVSAGLPFLGAPTTQERTLLFLCEDDEHELNRRQRDINNSLVLDFNDLSGRMRISSRKHHDNLLVLFDGRSGRMNRTPLWHALMRTIEDFQPGLVVVDTIADVFGGSEIDRQQVRQFVQGGLGAFSAATGCAVLALGHPSRAGESSGEGTSGSTAWHASVRSRLYLSHATKDGRGPFRKLEAKKANYGPAGSEWTLRWDRGAFSVHTAATVGTNSPNGGNPDKAEALAAAVLHAAEELANRKVALSLARNSPNYAAKVMQPMFHDMLGMYETKEIGVAIDMLVAEGRLVVAQIDRREGNRNPVYGLRVLATEPPDDDVFG